MNTKQSLLAELDRTDRRTMALLSDLDDAQLAVPYQPGINPPIWEVGHAAFFYEYFLLRALDDAAPRMPGYDEIWDSFEIQHRERWREGVVPDRATTLDYYRRVLDETRRRIETRPLTPRDLYLTKYVIFHQCMHIESILWCRQALGYPAPSFAGEERGPADRAPGHPRDVVIPAGDYPIGRPAGTDDHAAEGFCFDNEKPGFTRRLDAFAISATLVSNGEFLAFIEDGGYDDAAHWSFGGRHWLRGGVERHPLYWRRNGDGSWSVRRFDRWVPLDPAAPVMHVSYWEAEAYCRWAGRRLPDEYEWEAAARGAEGRLFPWGAAMAPGRADLDAAWMGSAPVDAFPGGASPAGCLQMIGTAWEWTTSQYLPYDGFCVDMYPYMSTLQFGDHKTTRGGSCATSSCLIRSTYRQAYFPSRRDVFVGFRTCAT